MLAAKLIGLIHTAWLLMIYIVTLVLSTFWVQDIFDHMMSGMAKKNPSLNWQPMAGKDVLVDLISRTVIVVIYAVGCLVASQCMAWPLTAVIEILTQSLLTAFYCYEYKSVAAGVDTMRGILMFEQQWVYWFGFGFPFAATQYYFKGIGGSVFFVAFPFLVILSLDEYGCGWEVRPVQKRVAS